MNFQLYFLKRNFDVQKAERYFKERKIDCQLVDLARHVPGKRELQLFARAAGGARKLIDTESKAYPTHFIRNLTGEDAILDALGRDARLLRTPIVRSGARAVIGFHPEIWEMWEE